MAWHAVRVTARLHREPVAASGAAPVQWLLMTHGIYGSGGNWRSIARKLVERRPAWGVVLVDLRGHGRSEIGAPPHTIAACAEDVAACMGELAGDGLRVDAACGHSFGGKVVLALRERLRERRPAVVQTWVLDSTPSVRPAMWDRPDNDVREVWQAMCELPREWPRREDFAEAIMARGHPRALAQWLAMNLDPIEGAIEPAVEGATESGARGFRLGLDLAAVKAMLLDYYAVDLWSAVEDPTLPGDIHVVIAERSDTVTADDRARLAAEPPERRVHAHLVAGAGHWLHIDAPTAVVDVIAGALPESSGH